MYYGTELIEKIKDPILLSRVNKFCLSYRYPNMPTFIKLAFDLTGLDQAYLMKKYNKHKPSITMQSVMDKHNISEFREIGTFVLWVFSQMGILYFRHSDIFRFVKHFFFTPDGYAHRSKIAYMKEVYDAKAMVKVSEWEVIGVYDDKEPLFRLADGFLFPRQYKMPKGLKNIKSGKFHPNIEL